jgi:hypothetical protein
MVPPLAFLNFGRGFIGGGSSARLFLVDDPSVLWLTRFEYVLREDFL